MGFADFFRKKSSSNVAKDRLKMVLVRTVQTVAGHYGADKK